MKKELWLFPVLSHVQMNGLWDAQALHQELSNIVSSKAVQAHRPSIMWKHVLPNGKPALLLDIGSVGNLAGDEWVRQQAAMALRAGLRPGQRRRERPLTVRGVGKGGEKCTHNCIFPVTLLNTEGHPGSGTLDTPTVPDSQLPALLGLSAARERESNDHRQFEEHDLHGWIWGL